MLQLIKGLAVYDINYPAIIGTYLAELGLIIDFKYISVDHILGLIHIDLSLKAILDVSSQKVKQTFLAVGFDCDNFIVNQS